MPGVQIPEPAGPGVSIGKLAERQYVDQFSTDTVGLTINVSGQLTDVDGQSMTVGLYDVNSNPIFQSRPAVRVGLGVYQYTFEPQDVANPGIFTLVWSYQLSGVADEYQTYIEVGTVSPAYDALDADLKMLIEGVWMRFADLFDSANGGPHLQFYYQTNFNRGRLAELLRVALNKLNLIQQPHQTFTIPTPQNPTAASNFPLGAWGGLLEQQLYVEALRHLVRSYTEQPQPQGVGTARLDRTGYAAQWAQVLAMEERDLKEMRDVFKIRNMGLGSPRVLVSGGVYGNYGPTRLAGSAVARPQYWARFY